MTGDPAPWRAGRAGEYPRWQKRRREEARVDIGPLKRVIEVEPVSLPIPEHLPDPERVPEPEPAEPAP